MLIKKDMVITVMATDGSKINYGDTVVFNAEGKCYTGVYIGLTDRGALKFRGKIAGTDVTWNVMPKSIKEIYKADVKVHDDEFCKAMNKPESEE